MADTKDIRIFFVIDFRDTLAKDITKEVSGIEQIREQLGNANCTVWEPMIIPRRHKCTCEAQYETTVKTDLVDERDIYRFMYDNLKKLVNKIIECSKLDYSKITYVRSFAKLIDHTPDECIYDRYELLHADPIHDCNLDKIDELVRAIGAINESI